jgi:hypothetical protein
MHRLRKVMEMATKLAEAGEKPHFQLEKSDAQLVIAFWTCLQLER